MAMGYGACSVQPATEAQGVAVGVGAGAGYLTRVDDLGSMSLVVLAVKVVVRVVVAIPKTSSAQIAAKRNRTNPPRRTVDEGVEAVNFDVVASHEKGKPYMVCLGLGP
jgi:hypothetical protein